MNKDGKFGKLWRFLIYTVIWHFVKLACDVILPNAHVFSKVRGYILSRFFKSCGGGFAMASGCVINCPWNLEVGTNVYLAHRVWVNASGGLKIGSGVIVSPNVVIATTAHAWEDGAVSHRRSKLAPVTIESGAWVASNSVVTRGSHIAQGAIVGANSVVMGFVEPRTLVAGNPARFVRAL